MSDLFFKEQNIDDKHTDDYVIELVKKELVKNGALKIDDVYRLIETSYGYSRMNRVRFRELVRSNFLNDKNSIWLSDDQKKEVFMSSRVVAALNKYALYNQKDLEAKFHAAIDELPVDTLNVCLIMYAQEIKSGHLTLEQAANLYNNIKNNYKSYTARISSAFININNTVNEMKCSIFVHNADVVDILTRNGVNSILSLRQLPVEIALVYLCFDPAGSINDLERLSGNIDERFVETLNSYFSRVLKPREFEVICDRYGLQDGCVLTLETIGQKNGVTRERIRQIESIANRKIKTRISEIRNDIEFVCRYHLAGMNREALSLEDFGHEIGSMPASRKTAFLLQDEGSDTVGYSSEFDAFYDKSLTDEKEIIDTVFEKYGDYLTADQYENESAFVQRIVKDHYHLSAHNKSIYLRNGEKIINIYASIIHNTFPNGYRTYDEDDYRKFINAYAAVMGENAEIPSQASLRGATGRSAFTQIDRGTYRATADCHKIPNSLLNDIVDFIIDHLPMVDYRTVYDHFTDRLSQIGIDNRFYLKGVLDPELPDGIITKRDYLTEEDNRISAVQDRLNYIHSFTGPFSIDDLRKRYPGVKDYTFTQLCYDEEKNGLLTIDNGTYIYADKIPFNGAIKDKIKNIIMQLFESTGSNVLNNRKIYARLKIKYPEILNGLKYINSQFALFSLLNYQFRNDFYFSRPWISIENNKELTTDGILYGYLRDRKSFTYTDIKNYIEKMNIRFNSSYISIMEDLSDEFVQINSHAAVRKDAFDISAAELNDFKQTIVIALAQRPVIDTSQFNGYQMFPKLKYSWNKFLMAGIVRSYLADDYDVTHEFNTHSEAIDFKIRRIDDGQ